MAMPAKDLTGQKFGFLTVLQRSGTSAGKNKKARWLCQCDCGQQVERESQYLRTKHRSGPRHCGCQHGNKKHGMSQKRPYLIWHRMLSRCTDPSDKDWKNYGGRGIRVCASWATSFQAFWRDMAPTYSSSMTLGRKNNNRGYSPSNCRWETAKQQANNTFQALVAQGKRAEALQFAQKFGNQLALNATGGAFRQQMGELATLRRVVIARQDLSAQEKRAQVDRIRQLEIALARRIRELGDRPS